MFSKDKNDLITKLEKLSHIAKDLNNEKLQESLKIFKDDINKDLTFNVLVLGEFNSGKSTFINKLFIEDDILPVGVVPMTEKLTTIKYGLQDKVVVWHGNNEKSYTENLTEVLKNSVSARSTTLENITQVEVYKNSDILKEGVIIIDSPGLNDTNPVRTQTTLQIVDNADSVLYLMPAKQPWSKSMEEFLENHVLNKESSDKIFILINSWDLIDTEDGKKDILEHVNKLLTEKINKIISHEKRDIKIPMVIPISSKTQENFDVVKSELWSYLGSKKSNEILNQKYVKFKIIRKYVAEVLQNSMELENTALVELNSELLKLEKELKDYENKAEEFKKSIKSRIDKFVQEWKENIKHYFYEIETNITSKIEQALPYKTSDEAVNSLIRNSIKRALLEKKLDPEKYHEKFLCTIQSFVEEQESQLHLDFTCHSKNLSDTLKGNLDVKKVINEGTKDTTSYIVATGLATAILAGSLAAPLTLLGLVVLGYGEFKVKKDLFKNSADDMLAEINENINEMISDKIKKFLDTTEQLTDDIIENISNNIIETYAQKKESYKEAISNKENNLSTKKLELLKSQIIELNNL